MKTQEDETCEHSKLLDKLNSEAKRTVQNVEAILKKGRYAVCRADATFSATLKDHVNKQTKKILSNLIDKLVDVNCDLEIDDDDSTVLSIPYISPGSNHTQLKFLMGDNPWNFWLHDELVDTKTIQKILLKKYQSDLLEPYPNAQPSESVCFYDRNKVFRGIVIQPVNEDRLRLQDCDSNAVRMVSTNNVFKVDIDACEKHASVIKCTISKESLAANLWTNDLQNLFWNILKEDIYQVHILERLPGPLPSFVVDIVLKSEDNDFGNLNIWIMDRIIPEVLKLTTGEDNITDFISSEILNPYYKNNNFNEKNITCVSDKAKHCDDKCKSLTSEHGECDTFTISCTISGMENDLSKIEQLDKLLPKADDPKDQSQLPCVIMHDSTKTSSASPCETECESDTISSSVINDLTNEVDNIFNKEVNKLKESSKEFQTIQSNIPPMVTHNEPYQQRNNSHHHAFDVNHCKNIEFPHLTSHQLQFTNPLSGQPLFPRHTGHPSLSNHCMPLSPSQWGSNSILAGNNSCLPLSFSSPMERSYSTENNPQSSNYPNTNYSKYSNINSVNVTVNVMAPEFVPNKCTRPQIEEKPKDINENQPGIPYSRVLPPSIKEIYHVEIRQPSTLLKSGEHLLVMMAHVETPSEFYVHFVSKNNKFIDKLVQDMFSDYNLTHQKLTFSSWREAKDTLGKFCACKWQEDNHWYRVEVLDWALGENQVKAYFVDYGNTEVVPLSSLQPLKPQYTKLSKCAQPCHLAEIHPINKGEGWSEESLQFFKSKVDETSKRAFTIIVVPSKGKNIKSTSLSVLLYEGKFAEDSVSINHEMVKCGFAWGKDFMLKSQSPDSGLHELVKIAPQVSEDTTTTKTSDLQVLPLVNDTNISDYDIDLESWDPQSEDFYSLRNNPLLNTDDACVAVVGYSAKDEARICKIYARTGFCPKNYCTKEHTMPNKDGTTTDKEATYMKPVAEISLPSVGEVLKVQVTSVVEMSIFYIQLTELSGRDVDLDEDDMTLSHLTDIINDPKNINNMKLLSIAPALGELVLARCNGLWHRARVLASDDYTDIEVMFVDFGSIATVDERDLRVMEPKYLHLPFQAIECTLANIEVPTNKEDYEKGSELLKETIERKVLTAKIISRSCGDYYKSMEITLKNKHGDIGEFLIEQGYATRPSF